MVQRKKVPPPPKPKIIDTISPPSPQKNLKGQYKAILHTTEPKDHICRSSTEHNVVTTGLSLALFQVFRAGNTECT